MKVIKIPDLSLVLLIGASGSGKSFFAHRHFKPTEILSSDFFRALICDNPSDQSVSKEAFELLHFVASKRLAAGRLTVIDATNVRSDARQSLLNLAQAYHVQPVAIVLHLSEKICQKRNAVRKKGWVPPHVIHNQSEQLEHSLHYFEREGFKSVYILDSVKEINSVVIERQRIKVDLKHDRGPFDIIGDIHGCFQELCQLLDRLGYRLEKRERGAGFDVTPPPGRKAIFLRDLVDRGPYIPEVLELVMDMVEAGHAYCVQGNHDMKLLKKVKGKNVKLTHGLQQTLEQLEKKDRHFIDRVFYFLEHLTSHYVLDEGKLVVAHAGLKEEFQGRDSGKVRAFALFGTTEGKLDEQGLPIRERWFESYQGKALVVYGHTPVSEPLWVNHTINIDTGCVFGGKLSAFRYPEKELISVSAISKYAEPARPLD